MHSIRLRRVLMVGALLAASSGLSGVAAPAASAVADTPYTLDSPVRVGPTSSPFASCTAGASADVSSAYTNAEVEPFVAVNPTDPTDVFGAFQQDRWADGGARGLQASHSTDGGASWSLSYAPFSACSGGPAKYGRVTDPWVSFDKGGKLYWIGQPIDSAELGVSAVQVTTWNGSGWNPLTTLIEDSGARGVFNDKVSITGDWTRAGSAYATWIRGDYPPGQRQSPTADFHSFAYRGQPMISRTTDGGATWSTPVPMRESNAYFQGNQIAVLPDGTLLNVAANLFTGAGLQPTTQGIYMGVLISRDAGRTWSGPVQIAPLRTVPLVDPDDPTLPVRAEDYLPDIAVDHRTGDVYVVWSDGLGGNVDRVVMSKSSDGGRHWSPPKVVAAGAPNVESFNHAVEVTANGTVTLTYYDFRNNVQGDGVATTDVWLRHSHDGGQTWEPEQHLYGPFDMRLAPVSEGRGNFLGDYQGLAATAGDDVITYFAAPGLDGADIWSVRAHHP